MRVRPRLLPLPFAERFLVDAYTYDADGNVSGKATAHTDEFGVFGHDAENRILLYYYYYRSTGGSGTATYKYDDSGARVTRSATKTDLPSESVTTIDPEYEVDHNRQRTRVHAYIGGSRIATIERAISTGSVGTPPSPVLRELDYHPNHLGTPRLVTDQTGAVIQRTLLKPFGETWKVLDGAGNEFTPSARATAYLFTGQHADVETGLHYFGARHYDPLIGRFLEVDPELLGPTAGVTFERIGGAPQSLDAYSYASNNPINRIDRSGRSDGLPSFQVSSYVHGLDVETATNLRLAETRGLLLGGAALVAGWAAWEAAPLLYSAAAAWAVRDPYRAGQTIGQSIEGLLGEGPGSVSSAASKSVGAIRHSIAETQLRHIFRVKEGHMLDSPGNRQLLLDVADDVRTTLGPDRFGTIWSALLREDGTQVWVQSRNGQIVNGGVNQTPRIFNFETGLSAP